MSDDTRKKVYTNVLCKAQDTLSSLLVYWLTEERRNVIENCIEIIEEMKDEQFQYMEDAE